MRSRTQLARYPPNACMVLVRSQQCRSGCRHRHVRQPLLLFMTTVWKEFQHRQSWQVLSPLYDLQPK